MADDKPGLVQGFKEFVMRGNVIDLAVAVVVGAAFGAVVKAFTDNIINPVINALGGPDTSGWGFFVDSDNAATFVNIGAVITVVIQFLITMLVVYFVFVVPMNKARDLARIVPKTAETPPDVLLLTEIRDLLAAERGLGSGPGSGSGSGSGKQ